MAETSREYRIQTKVEWDTAHRVPLHHSKCKHIHGHRYVAEFTVESTFLSEEGFVVDFGLLKDSIKKWVDDNWDHNTVAQENDPIMRAAFNAVQACGRQHNYQVKDWYWMDSAPTAENMAVELFTHVGALIDSFFNRDDRHVALVRVRLWETPNNSAEFPVG